MSLWQQTTSPADQGDSRASTCGKSDNLIAETSSKLADMERTHILVPPARHNDNRTAAAADINISRHPLHYRLRKYQKGR